MESNEELELIEERVAYYEEYTGLLDEKISKVKLLISSVKEPDLNQEILLVDLKLDLFHKSAELKAQKRLHQQYIELRVQAKTATEQTVKNYTEQMTPMRLAASNILSNISVPQEYRDRFKALLNATPETDQEKHFIFTTMKKELEKCKQYTTK